MRPDSRGALAGLTLALIAGPVLAQTDQTEDNQVHGRLEVQDAEQFAGPNSVQAQLREQTANDVLGNLRLAWGNWWRNGGWGWGGRPWGGWGWPNWNNWRNWNNWNNWWRNW